MCLPEQLSELTSLQRLELMQASSAVVLPPCLLSSVSIVQLASKVFLLVELLEVVNGGRGCLPHVTLNICYPAALNIKQQYPHRPPCSTLPVHLLTVLLLPG